MTLPDVLPNSNLLPRAVMLTYGRMQEGKGTYWCYVAVKPSEYDRFQRVTKAGKMDLHRFEENGFGEIIVSGPGVLPPADVTRQVAELYNTDIRDLFGDIDPLSVIERKIAKMKESQVNQ